MGSVIRQKQSNAVRQRQAELFNQRAADLWYGSVVLAQD